MKTHAVKENRILKSFDFVLIVLTMSFVSFMILKSMAFYPELTNPSRTSASMKVEFPVLQQKGIAVNNENTAQETTMINTDPAGNTVSATKGWIHSEAATVDQSLNITAKSKITEIAPVTDSQLEKTNLEQWIKSRDDWEQK